ncbi:hypothetical protein ACFWAA_17185 [Streptomyces sp. NPDC059922]|uniref:hypothetical protein n=1 Tax=Streptomyces sp. NPDC059922 TaxID=3347005 RepID=UPI0036661443
MSSHAKPNRRSLRRGMGAAIGAALLLGAGFATQAVADSGEKKPSPVAPDVVDGGTSAGEVKAPKAVAPEVVAEGKPGGEARAPKAAAPEAAAEGVAPEAAAESVPAAEGKAPKVVSEGRPASVK